MAHSEAGCHTGANELGDDILSVENVAGLGVTRVSPRAQRRRHARLAQLREARWGSHRVHKPTHAGVNPVCAIFPAAFLLNGPYIPFTRLAKSGSMPPKHGFSVLSSRRLTVFIRLGCS